MSTETQTPPCPSCHLAPPLFKIDSEHCTLCHLHGIAHCKNKRILAAKLAQQEAER